MTNIRLIIPYFGKLPNNMYTFLRSCKNNKKITWLIFTDQDFKPYVHICRNVFFIKSSLNRIRKRILYVTHLSNINLNKPYKLCDYKPLYGKIFSEYLNGCDYWGYTDLDIVYGDLYKFIHPGIINNYQKIGVYGHFTLFKNDDLMNNLYKRPIIRNGHKIYIFRDIISKTPKTCHFDEYKGINILCKQNDIEEYTNLDLVNDISFENLDLNTRDKRYTSPYSCYIWNNGHDEYYYVKNNRIFKHEYGYFHFQKRHEFKHFIQSMNFNIFSITTYGYHILPCVNEDEIKSCMHKNKSKIIKRIIYLLKWYILSGNIFHTNMKEIFKRLFIERNFRI